MPIKDQCANCKHTISTDSCAVKGTALAFEGVSCPEYVRRINLDKHKANISLQLNFENVNNSSTLKIRECFNVHFLSKEELDVRNTVCPLPFYFIYYFPMEISDENNLNKHFALFWLMFLSPMLGFQFAPGAKRCHDKNNSGWYQIIPFYGLRMLSAKGDSNTNNYGKPPK